MHNLTTPGTVCTLVRGTRPLLISMPHMGTTLPDELAARMTQTARHLDDTDWYMDTLYAFADTLGASVLKPIFSRYVIDLNRPPDGANLYPGQNTTGLCPTDTFAQEPLYAVTNAPDEHEIAQRIELFWKPYHQTLHNELKHLLEVHGHVLLWDAHSIRSEVPRFFEGQLPDFNFGTLNDTTTSPGLAEKLADFVRARSDYTAIANGRFKGGYITRHYGAPDRGIHAVQLELSQITYMKESRPYAYDPILAKRTAQTIRQTMEYTMSLIQN